MDAHCFEKETDCRRDHDPGFVAAARKPRGRHGSAARVPVTIDRRPWGDGG
jgi:hypothetical protein